MVDKEHLAELLDARGWYVSYQERRGKGKRFIYAKRRARPGSGQQSISRYLTAESKLDELTDEEVLKRIQS